MQRQRLYSLFFCSIISSLLMLIGCSKPILKMPKPLPPIVKQYKHITLPAGVPGMRNTRIYMEEGDFYSILATGSIDMWPRGPDYHDVRPEHGWPLMVRVGKEKENIYFAPFYNRNAFTSHSYESGSVYLGYRSGKVTLYGEPLNPEYYRDDIGSFSVDIIIWKREDYVQIADFFEKMNEKDPENRSIIDALKQANRYKNIYLAEAKASKEIEETKKEIQKLKEESDLEAYDAMKYKELYLASKKDSEEIEEKPSPQAKPPTVGVKKQEKITQLETKMAKLTETLTQLEEMKKQFEEERKKTSLLTKELEEKEMREKDLLSQLERAEKNPPVIVVAAPKDGVEVEVGTITFSGVAEDDQGLKALDIFINNNPLLAKVSGDIKLSGTKHPKRVEFAERILLQGGKNEIKIRAIDSDGLTTEKILTV